MYKYTRGGPLLLIHKCFYSQIIYLYIYIYIYLFKYIFSRDELVYPEY